MMMNLMNPLIMSNGNGKIKTFADFNRAKQNLNLKISQQESEILSSPFFTIPAALFEGKSFKSSLKNSMESISVHDYKKVVINLLSTALMANKKTRKFFVAFVIAKEMVPFILEKVNEFVKK